MVPTLLDDATDVIAGVACMSKQPDLIEKKMYCMRGSRGGAGGPVSNLTLLKKKLFCMRGSRGGGGGRGAGGLDPPPEKSQKYRVS